MRNHAIQFEMERRWIGCSEWLAALSLLLHFPRDVIHFPMTLSVDFSHAL